MRCKAVVVLAFLGLATALFSASEVRWPGWPSSAKQGERAGMQRLIMGWCQLTGCSVPPSKQPLMPLSASQHLAQQQCSGVIGA